MQTIEERYSIGAKALILLLAINIPLAAVKLVFGISSMSAALVSSSILTTMTALTTVSTLTAMRLATRRADKQKFFVQSKLGVMFSRLVATLLVIFGIVISRGNAVNLITGDYARPRWPAILIAAISIIIKEYAYIVTRRAAARTHNSAIMTEAINQRIDMGVAAGAMLGALIGMLWVPALDPVMGMMIGAALAWMGLQLWWTSIAELLEEKLDPQLIGSIKKVLEAVPARSGKFTLKEATARKYGGFVYVEVVVGMDPSISLFESHSAADRIESLIKKALPFVSGVDVEAEPVDVIGEAMSDAETDMGDDEVVE